MALICIHSPRWLKVFMASLTGVELCQDHHCRSRRLVVCHLSIYLLAKAIDTFSTTRTEASDHDSNGDPPRDCPIAHQPYQSGNLEEHRSCYTVDEHTGSSDVFQEVETNKQKEGLLVDRQKEVRLTCQPRDWSQDANSNKRPNWRA